MLSPPPFLLTRHAIVTLIVLQLQIMVNFIECQQQQQLLHHHHHLRGNTNCPFNTMCSCQWGTSGGSNNDANSFMLDGGGPYIHDIACLGVPLTKLPNLPRGRIGQVDVAESGLQYVNAEPLSGAKIESLRLMNNKIQYIDDKAFSTMAKSLASLDLAYNKLDSVPFNAFRELQNLQWLNLVGNQIRSLEGDWSFLQNTLTSLLISDNDIVSLPGNNDLENSHHQQDRSPGLRDLHVLLTLNIDGNKINHLEPNMLPKNLQTLSISNNLLTELPSQVIDSLKRLQWIDFRMNQIVEIPLNYSYRPYRQVEKFDLGENRIKYLPRELFNNSMQVRNLILDFNFIEKISNDVFSGVNCGRLILSYNQISQVHGRAFHGVDSSLEYLDLEHNKLMSYPVIAFSRLNILKYLYFSSNYLKEVPDNAFHSFAHSLRALSLSGNQLTSIPTTALENCTKLSYLNLGYNQILEVFETDLTGWAENLNTLILRSNRITYIDQNLFNFTKNLRELSLSFNPINYIHPNAFTNISETIETLEISFAIVEEQFPQELLKPLHSLLWLSIDNNNIEVLQKNALNSLESVQFLTMESNKIVAIPPSIFRADIHQGLTDLRLSNNRIELLETNAFQSLQSLHSVLLGGNHIEKIETHAFNNLTSLIKIVLSHNRITEIAHSAFTNLPILTKLDIQNNNLFSFSMDSITNSSSKQFPINLNLSYNNIFEVQPPKDIIHVQTLDLSHNNLQVPPKYMLEKITTSLRRLHLSYNRIESLELEAFGLLEELEELNIKSNIIGNIRKHAFVGLDSLQLLDLSCNDIQTLHVGQFSYLQRLRTLDLSHNHLRYLPKDIFRNTKLEKLKLSNNEFTSIPSAVLTDIGMTLRDFSISNNNIEHIDSTMFLATPYILNLDLSYNRLNLLPDNVFTSLGNIQKLNLNFNPLRANFKELFHYAQSLKYLHLANIGLQILPQLPLPNLVFLNISANLLEDIPRWSLKGLTQLRILVIRNNMLKVIPAHVWMHLPALKRLELSHNPIKEITSKCFYGLNDLQILHLDNLSHLSHFDPEALSHLRHLSSLTIRLTNKIPLKKILSNVTSLQTLSIEVTVPHLNKNHLSGVLTPRTKTVEIWGSILKTLERDIFTGLEHNTELIIKIRDTQIEELPGGVIANLYRIPHLRLDVRNNQLMSLTPDVFYTNTTTWESLGTKLIAGGLLLNDNPWVCDCRLIWLGHWLRRWVVESLQIHTLDPDSAQLAHDRARAAKCTHPDSGVVTAIVDLRPEHMSCQASALSTSPTHILVLQQKTLILVSVTISVYMFSICGAIS